MIFGCCIVVLHSDHCDNVHRQFGSRVIHEVRRVVLSSGGRTGLPTKIKYGVKLMARRYHSLRGMS